MNPTLSKHYVKFIRSFCTAIKLNHVKPFEDIPGPVGPFGLGTLYKYLPIIGSYKWNELHRIGKEKYCIWGPIVREKIVPDVTVVWLFDPNDIAKVLNDSSPGVYPRRKSHLALEKYRKDRSHIYKSGGLLPTNGPEWWRIRSEFQKGLSSPTNVRSFLSVTDDITDEFVINLEDTRVNDDVPDFLPTLARLNLELLCHLVFDVRMNSFSESELDPKSRSSKLIEAAETTNSLTLPTDQGLQLWRYFETPKYRKLRKAQEFMESVAVDFVTQKLTYFDQTNATKEKDNPRTQNPSLLDDYLKNPNIDLADITGMAGDMLLAGIDTTTYTTCFVLYHLAQHPTVQQKLYQETCDILPDSSAKLEESIFHNRASYARAVLKESLRLNPISIGVGRKLNSDLVLSGYSVPQGTEVVTQNLVACRLPRNFVRPEEFRPERWLKEEKSKFNAHVNPYLVLPFGHGMRACIARRLAEQNMLVLMIRLVRQFEIGWAGRSGLDIKTDLINKPDQPVRLTFKRR
ncbi:cytochrome P450 302a1, mitochondrial isoform X1 [Bradysia coprophila]|uniref:cytochrome P450 302a1, mitochondrial isoform X1 n=1 Tax=Bradysia coprophila TaxID=38358 RepID=UPI00187D9DA7|nr:cytochrome P450 302a1, mitochondrial isoform X1 [Bradysia coprophila]XP_037044692.1 cytochrome P450 302a1, mitochondrial isoform X1 [Bradysia coprophila]